MSSSRPYNEPNLSRDQRLERTIESLETNSSVVCIPWTGRDISGVRYCPGFEWHPNLGLVCYVMPLILLETEPALRRDMVFPVTGPAPSPLPAEDQIFVPDIGVDNAADPTMRLIENYVRRLRIIVPPQFQVNLAANPMVNNAKYYVIAQGAYPDSLYGLLIERPDPTGVAYSQNAGSDVEVYSDKDNRPHTINGQPPGPGIDSNGRLTSGQRMRARFESVGLVPIRGGCRSRSRGYSWFNVRMPAVKNAQAVWQQYVDEEEA